MENISTRDLIIEVVNKLFVFTDMQEWDKLQSEVFTENVLFDMASMGGERGIKTAMEICEMWQRGFVGIDSVNHLAGNYLVDIRNKEANVFAYATATHYKQSATNGSTREFVGTYQIQLKETENGWRINAFKYNLKFATGNVDLS